MTFEPVDYERFPCLRLAREAIETGKFAPAVLNAANEVAVNRFLSGDIDYLDIPQVVEECLAGVDTADTLTVESLKAIDRRTRDYARNLKFNSTNN
jgi:1-deoxy-D-xylulose-5-phosphate reductoisomerase